MSTETLNRPAIAPCLTLIVPTGDEDKGLGAGSVGYQFNLPVSKIVSDRTTVHFNAGVTSYADLDGRQPTSYNLGGSAIYAVTREAFGQAVICSLQTSPTDERCLREVSRISIFGRPESPVVCRVQPGKR